MKRIGYIDNFSGGISPSKKLGIPNSFAFARGVDFRTEPTELTVLPKATKISGSIVTDLPMCADQAESNLWFHGNTGKIYKVDENDTTTLEYTVPDSVGNGLVYFPEDKGLYIPTNKSISRRLNAIGAGDFYDSFLESEGGAPTNTHSLQLLSASSQSATRADTASLSLTGDLTLEAYLKFLSLPTGTDKMSIISKWDESGALRSYKLDLITTSASFGDGSDGALTISADTTEAPIDGNCTGTIDTNTLTVSNTTGTFAVGQKILIHQSRGTGAGTRQVNEITAVVGSTLTLADNLTFSPAHSATTTVANKAQVRVLPQYTNVTIDSGKTYTAKAWDGLKGGILAFLANGTVTVTGSISATGKGFIGGTGGNGVVGQRAGFRGEGTSGDNATRQTTANGNAGGGGGVGTAGSSDAGGGGGGGAHASTGSSGTNDNQSPPGVGGTGGASAGSADLTTIDFGGSGGGGGSDDSAGPAGLGGNGGGIIFISGATFTVSGSIVSNGSNGTSGSADSGGGGGGGAGGSILIKAQTATLGTSLLTVAAGTGATGRSAFGGVGGNGGNGTVGRIHLDYYTSYSGTTSPTLDVAQDDNLGIANGYALRLYISSTGSNSETLTQNIDNPQDTFRRFSVTWDASASTAKFYQNGTLLGTRVGALTSIHDNATEFALGCSKDSGGTRANFIHSLVDDVRIWNVERTESQISVNNNKVLTGGETGLVAYYKLDNAVTDSQTSGLNNLTANNAPTYSTTIAFSGVSVRGDEDVFIETSGQTYTLTTAVNEGATHRQTFTPTKEPLKSIALNIGTVGTGSVTIVIHDALNRVLASVTVANADLRTGVFEFILSDSVRPILNSEYHIHAYSSVADTIVVTGTSADFETAYLKTYFQILVDDEYHPGKQFLNFLAIANERYLAVLEAGGIYNPHRITLPSGYRIRTLSYWNNYLAIGTWKGDDVTDTAQGKVFFWNGTDDTYAEPLDVPQGAINALFGQQGTLWMVAGSRGQILKYTGGTEAIVVGHIPERELSDTLEIAPGAMTMHDALFRIGATLNTSSDTVHQGIYSFGKQPTQPSECLGFENPLSLGDQQSSSVKVGCLFSRGQKMYSGWKNATAGGIDVYDPSAEPYTTATIEFLIADLGKVPQLKVPLLARIDFLPLETGQEYAIKYKPNRAGSWTTIGSQDTVGATELTVPLLQRLKEVQFAIDITSGTTSPKMTSFALEMEGEENAKVI